MKSSETAKHFWLAYGFLVFIIIHAINQWNFAKAFVVKKFKKNKLQEKQFTS